MKASFDLLMGDLNALPREKRALVMVTYAAQLAENAAYEVAGDHTRMTVSRLILSSAELYKVVEILNDDYDIEEVD